MKYALVNGEKVEATKGAKGLCPSCGSELIARCGEEKVNHWAHKGNRNCDPWWENETDWHRSWKNNFPKDWQEVPHSDDESGEKHIADIKTDSGWILEFQHSALKPEERRSRNAFYSKLVWVVDGTRRKTDKRQFQEVIKDSIVVYEKPRILKVRFPEECRLLREWHGSNASVFFDFQEAKETRETWLGFLIPRISTSDNTAYILFMRRVEFIELHNNNHFDEIVGNVKLLLSNLEHIKNIKYQSKNQYSKINKLPGFRRSTSNKHRRDRPL